MENLSIPITSCFFLIGLEMTVSWAPRVEILQKGDFQPVAYEFVGQQQAAKKSKYIVSRLKNCTGIHRFTEKMQQSTLKTRQKTTDFANVMLSVEEILVS